MYRTLVTRDADDDLLNEIMNGPVTEALNIPKHVVWGSQSGVTFRTLYTEFMKPVINYGMDYTNSNVKNIITIPSLYSGITIKRDNH